MLDLKYKNKIIQVACDGAGATGKSTGAKMISKKFKLKFLSSGLLYRYAALLIIKNNPKNHIPYLKKKFKNLNYSKIEKINLHSPEISKKSSEIAKVKSIRDILKKFQINFSEKDKKCCIEGRDIATKILPNSDIKFFFTCNLKIAASRRYKELKKFNKSISLKDVKKSLRKRNFLDINRKNSPLLKHPESIEIDSGKLTKQAMLAKMIKNVEKVIKTKYGK